MPRELPKIDLLDDTFIVDVKRGGLVHAQEPERTLLFSEMAQCKDIWFHPDEAVGMITAHSVRRFFYNNIEKAIAALPDDCKQLPPNISLIEILREGYLDPMGLALQRGAQAHKIPRYYRQPYHHLGRRIPTVRIAGQDFIVDMARSEIRHISGSENRVSSRHVKMNPNQQTMDVMVHPSTALLFDGPAEKAPADLIKVSLPHVKQLDPIGFARRQGISTGFLKDEQEAIKKN